MIEMKVNLIQNENSLDLQNSIIPLTITEEKSKLVVVDKILETVEKFPELSTQNSINSKCVMNTFLIFNDAEYSAFTCLACNIENICQNCYEKCHAGHNMSNLKGSNQSKTVTIKNTSCGCAMNDHVGKGGDKQAEFKRTHTNQNSSNEVLQCCPLNEIIALSNPVYNYFDEKIKMNICTFCTYYCMDDENYFPGKGLAKIKSGLGDKKTSCGCVKSDNHGTVEENITNIYNIMKDINLNIEINGVKLTYQLLTNKIIVSKFFGGLISNCEIVRSSIERGGPTIKEMWGVTRGNFSYDIVIQLLESMADRYSSRLILPKVLRKRDTQDFNLNENLPEDGPINTISNRSESDSGPTLETFFNPEFLIRIFSLPERKGDVLFSFKLNCLKFYRKFVFLPMIKNRNFYSLASHENVTGLHRILLGRTIPDEINFYNSNGSKGNKKNNSSSQPILEILLDKVLNSFLNYSEKEIETFQYIQLGIELLKFYKKIIPFYNLDYTKLTKTFEKVEKVMSALKTKKAYENLVIKHLEKIIYSLIILNNDYILYSKISLDDNNSKENLKDFKFSFQKSEFNKKMILTLFSYSLDATDNTDYVLNKQVYDILVNENDYYSENLENMMNSKFVEILNHENFPSLLKLSESKKDQKDSKDSKDNYSYNLKNFFVSPQEEETKKVLLLKIENFEKQFETYLANPGLHEEILIKNLMTDLKDYKSVIEEFLGVSQNVNQNVNAGNLYNSENYSSEKEKNLNNPNLNIQLNTEKNLLQTEKNLNQNSEENKFSSFRKKMGLFKIGCFDVLFNFCKFFNLELYFTQPIFTEKIRQIMNLIFEIFDLFSADNPFISSLFFSKSIITTFFKNEFIFRENVKFYLKKLKILSKADYKINSEFLIEKILEQANFEEYTSIDNESKETILKIFVCLLKITSGKSLMIINDRISSEIIKILFSDDFLKEIDDFLVELQKTKRTDISNDNFMSNLSQSDPESGKGLMSNMSKKNSKGGFLNSMLKKKTIFTKSEVSSTNTLRNPLQYIEIIKLTYSSINLLAPEYFYLIAESLKISKISEILQNFKSLEPDKRRIFTQTYFRFYVESYFKIHIEMSQELLQTYLEEIDVNNINMNFKKNQKLPNLQNTIQEEQHELDLLNDISDVRSNPEEETENSLKGMEPILKNLEKFRSIYNSQSEYFKKAKLNMKYFQDVIFFPTLYSIYKICYFEKDVSAKFKYTVYRLIFLFMQCFKFHCENLKNFDFIVKENHDKFVKYFYISTRFKAKFEINQENTKKNGVIQKPNDSIPNEENQKLIVDYLDKLITSLENDISLMDSNQFEQLNLRTTIEIYFKYAANFVSYLNIITDANPEKFEESNFNLSDSTKLLQNSNSVKNLNRDNSSTKNLHNSSSAINLHNSGLEKNTSPKENLLDGLKNSLGNLSNLKISPSQKISDLLEDYKTKKENYDEDNILNEIFSIDPDVDPYIQPVKDTIALDLMKKLELPKTSNTLSLYNEQNTKFVNSITKLFKTDPTTWQKVIVDSAGTSKYFFQSVISKQLSYLFQFITIEFNRLDTNFSAHHKKNFLSLLEFIRLLCEDHNRFFQTFLIHSKIFDDKDDEKDLYLINFLLKIPLMIITYVQYLVKKKDIRKFFKYDSSFFTDVIEKITQLLIEIMQGAFSFNFDRICKCKEFEDYYETHYKILDFLDTEHIFEIITSNFIQFLNCFIEENSNSQENKLDLVKKLNPGKLCDVMISSFKKLYLREIKSEDENMKISQNMSKIFKRNFHEEMLQACLKRWEDISGLPLFVIASGVFIYFKRISYYKGGINEKVKRILENLEKLSQTKFELIETENETAGKKNKQQWLEIVKSELFLFLNKMVKEVEICYRQDEIIEDSELKRYKSFFDHDHDTMEILTGICEKNSEEIVGIDKVIFLVHPNSLFIRKKDYYEFISEAPLDNFNSKLNFALEYFPEIMNILQMRKMLNNLDSSLLRKLYELDYNNLEVVCALISTVANGLMFLSIQYKLNYSEFPNIIQDNLSNGTEEIPMQDHPSYEIADPYFALSYPITIFHIIFLGSIILNWFTFAIVKHIKYNTEKMNFFYRIFLYLSFIFKSEIFPFIWNFTFNLIPLLNTNLKFLAALQLFTIFNIFPTMSSVLFAVRIRYKQFASTGFLLGILILFYSSLIFYFYRDELYNDEIQENICGTFLQCFMHMLNYGIRAGDGVSFEIKTLNMAGYWSEFIFSWVFYFSIMLIMINIINGIIVDTFQALREQNNERDDAMVNVCYICSLNRQKFEIKGLNFEDHVEREHYVLNYFEYFSRIIMTDEHDLNSLDFQVLNSINQGRTDFFPIKKAKCLEKN